MTPAEVGPFDADARRAEVRTWYGNIASSGGCCSSDGPTGSCGDGHSSCCGGDSGGLVQLGYSAKELAELPGGANLGLGCGNPTALLSLRPGEVVLDLGSGGGIDCFLASNRVGPTGKVIGVDMTPEMLAKARANAAKGGFKNVEFRLGEIEHLPVPDNSVDVVISNCVINLAPDKGEVYQDAFRVLRPGGRFAVSDMVATRSITARERADPTLWSSCTAGALEVDEIRALLGSAGFESVAIDVPRSEGTPSSLEGQVSLGVVSAQITATKPHPK